MLSGRSHCDGPIPHPKASYRVYVCVPLSVIYTNNERVEMGHSKKERKVHIV
jgi:7,8-dihydro-6-hydroxymethylpterin-pyrophosphokinase